MIQQLIKLNIEEVKSVKIIPGQSEYKISLEVHCFTSDERILFDM